MLSKYMAGLLVLSVLVCQLEAQKKYPLVWRFRKGLHNVMKQKLKIERTIYKVNEGSRKKISDENVEIDAHLHWKIQNVIKNSQALATSIIKNGKVKLRKDGKTYVVNVENPVDRKKVETPPLSAYTRIAKNGIAFLLDIKSQEVQASWELTALPNGKYERKLVRGEKDPRGMGYAYKQLINQKVPLGYEWDLKRKNRQFTYHYHYIFTKIVKYKGSSVAQIDVTGKIFWRKQKVGTLKGRFYHDYERYLMLLYQMKEDIEQKWTKKINDKKQNFLYKTKINLRWQLIKTNASK